MFTPIHFTLEPSTRELELSTGLTKLRCHLEGNMWNYYDKLSVIFDKLSVKNPKVPPQGSLEIVESLTFHFVGPKAMGFQAFPGMSSVVTIHWLKLLRALDEGLSTSSIKVPLIASSSSQCEL